MIEVKKEKTVIDDVKESNVEIVSENNDPIVVSVTKTENSNVVVEELTKVVKEEEAE